MALPARVVVAQQELGDVIELANGPLGWAIRANRRSGRKELAADAEPATLAAARVSVASLGEA